MATMILRAVMAWVGPMLVSAVRAVDVRRVAWLSADGLAGCVIASAAMPRAFWACLLVAAVTVAVNLGRTLLTGSVAALWRQHSGPA